MLRILAIIYLLISVQTFAQGNNPYNQNKNIAVIDSIRSYKDLNGFLIGDENSNCTYEFDSINSLKAIPYSCVIKKKPIYGTYSIDKSVFKVMIAKDTSTYEIVTYKGYYFFVNINKRAVFVSNVNEANQYLKQGKLKGHPILFLRNFYFYKRTE